MGSKYYNNNEISALTKRDYAEKETSFTHENVLVSQKAFQPNLLYVFFNFIFFFYTFYILNLANKI